MSTTPRLSSAHLRKMSTPRLVNYLRTLRAKETRLLNSHSHPYLVAQAWGNDPSETKLELAETVTDLTGYISDVKDVLKKRENLK